VGSSSAAELEYKESFDGSDAVGATAPFPNLRQMDQNGTTEQLLVGSAQSIYQFSSSGTSQPFGALAPSTAFSQSLNPFADVAVDNSGGAGGVGEGEQGRIYSMNESGPVNSRKPNGEPLGGNFPLSYERACGIAVAPNGTLWVASWGETGKVEQFTSAGAPTGTSFEAGFGLCGLAIDSANNFYVIDEGGPLLKFNSAGVSLGIFDPDVSNGEPKDVAIDRTNDHVYVDHSAYIKEFDPSGALVDTFGEAEGSYPGLQGSQGLAIRSSDGYVYVTNNDPEHVAVDVFGPANDPEVETGSASGITRTTATVSGSVDPAGKGDVTDCYFKYGTASEPNLGTVPCSPAPPFTVPTNVSADLTNLSGSTSYNYRLFAANAVQTGAGATQSFKTAEAIKFLSTDPATEVETTTATLHGTIDPDGFATTFYFQYGPTESYGRTTAAHPGVALGTSAPGNTPASVDVESLLPGQLYHYRIVGVNSTGTSVGQDETFETFQPPSIDSFTSSNVTGTSADIGARINPHGAETTYYVEYGTTPEYGETAPIPPAVLAVGEIAVPVTIPLSDLQGVTYHFRVVAESQWGTTRTGDQTFSFYPPDCPNATVRQQTSSQYLPDCRAYELVSPAFAGNVVLRNLPFYPSPYASSPARFIFGGALGSIAGAGDSQSNAIVDKYVATRTNTGWNTRYVGLRGSEVITHSGIFPSRDLGRFIDFKVPTSAPFLWDFNGQPLGRWPTDVTKIPGVDKVKAAWQPSPDFTHLAIASTEAVFDEAQEGLNVAPGSAYDYDASTGTTTVISKLPGGGDIPQEPTNADPTEFIHFPGANGPFGPEYPAVLNPGVSIDGSHILMSTAATPAEGAPVHLYMRVGGAGGVTYDVSHGSTVTYVGMTDDGSKVFFSSSDQLTADDTDTSVDLYRWTEFDDTITRISTGILGAGDSDACSSSWTVQCGVEPASGGAFGGAYTDYPIALESGDILFYSPELLDGPENGTPGSQNVYLYRNGTARFVVELPADGSAPLTRVQVSPDGDHLAFITTGALTSYDNAGFAQMYSYDVQDATLRCVSCNPTGAPPTENVLGSTNGLFMSDDGRPFWSTSDGLVPKDTNGLIDVYEFVEERPQLISSGTADEDSRRNAQNKKIAPSGFAGVSADGIDAYFSSYDTLVTQDRNGPYMKFYDARTNGGFASPPVRLPCVAADECHGDTSPTPPAPQIASDGDLGEGGNVAHRKRKKAHRRAKKRHKKAPRHRSGKHRDQGKRG
jgi:hypothetical protein